MACLRFDLLEGGVARVGLAAVSSATPVKRSPGEERLSRPMDRGVSDPSAARSKRVSLSTSSTMPAGRPGLRPRPLAMRPNPSAPCSANTDRQRPTAFKSTSQRRAISLATPSPAHKRPRPCTACLCGMNVEIATRFNSPR